MDTSARQIHNFKEGDLFDRHYRLLELVGSGGFADVWRANDELVGTVVALKIYTRLDHEGISELAKEYKDMKGVKHPNLLTGNHFDANGNIPYLEMDYCDGGSLFNKMGKMSTDELHHVLRDIASGLAYLHSKGIVHQDIKPENILYDTVSNTYLLSDFGISGKSRTRLSRSVNMAQMNLSMTEAYAPPEKFSGNLADIEPDTKGDIFSLGMTVFELAVGKLPFTQPMSTGREMLYSHGRLQLDYSSIGDPLLRRIVEGCTQYGKDERLTADEVLAIMEDDILLNQSQETDSSSNKREQQRYTKKIEVNDSRKSKKSKSSKQPVYSKQSKPKPKPTPNSKRLYWAVAVVATLLAIVVVYLILQRSAVLDIFDNTRESQNDAVNNTENNIPDNYVLCPAGILKDIDNGNGSKQDIMVDSFYISKYEVTQSEWKTIFPDDTSFVYKARYASSDSDKWKSITNDSIPIERTIDQLIRFCIEKNKKEGYDGFYHIYDGKCVFDTNGNGYRLPNVYEWLYASRGNGEKHRYFAGDDLKEIAWYAENSQRMPHPIGLKNPNELGIYDMCGNIEEACWPIDKRNKIYPYSVMGGGYADWKPYLREHWFYVGMSDYPIGMRLVFIPRGIKNNNVKIYEIPCK